MVGISKNSKILSRILDDKNDGKPLDELFGVPEVLEPTVPTRPREPISVNPDGSNRVVPTSEKNAYLDLLDKYEIEKARYKIDLTRYLEAIKKCSSDKEIAEQVNKQIYAELIPWISDESINRMKFWKTESLTGKQSAAWTKIVSEEDGLGLRRLIRESHKVEPNSKFAQESLLLDSLRGLRQSRKVHIEVHANAFREIVEQLNDLGTEISQRTLIDDFIKTLHPPTFKSIISDLTSRELMPSNFEALVDLLIREYNKAAAGVTMVRSNESSFTPGATINLADARSAPAAKDFGGKKKKQSKKLKPFGSTSSAGAVSDKPSKKDTYGKYHCDLCSALGKKANHSLDVKWCPELKSRIKGESANVVTTAREEHPPTVILSSVIAADISGPDADTDVNDYPSLVGSSSSSEDGRCPWETPDDDNSACADSSGPPSLVRSSVSFSDDGINSWNMLDDVETTAVEFCTDDSALAYNTVIAGAAVPSEVILDSGATAHITSPGPHITDTHSLTTAVRVEGLGVLRSSRSV